MVLGFSELQKEDRPPREMWLDDEALAEHFDRLERKHESGGGGSGEDHELLQNELTRDLRRR